MKARRNKIAVCYAGGLKILLILGSNLKFVDILLVSLFMTLIPAVNFVLGVAGQKRTPYFLK
jgi:hypothetical protein